VKLLINKKFKTVCVTQCRCCFSYHLNIAEIGLVSAASSEVCRVCQACVIDSQISVWANDTTRSGQCWQLENVPDMDAGRHVVRLLQTGV